MNEKRSEVKKVHKKDAKKPSEDKDGVTEGDYNADDPEDEEATAVDGVPDDEKRKKGSSPGSRKNGSREATLPGCQVEKCSADLSGAKKYHRRHKVCEVHAKAPIVIIASIRQRFCQQCSFTRWVSLTNRRGAAEDAWQGTTSAAGRVVPATTTEKTRAAVGLGILKRRKVNASNQTKEAESRLLYLGIKLIKQLDDSR